LKKADGAQNEKAQIDILKDMFVALLVMQGIPQQNVRKIVRIDLSRVTRIAKLLKTKKPA